jgi:hypothetical protein
MAKKKNITRDDIYTMYMDYVLKNGKPPANVYIFSKENNFDESLFYQFFGSFDAVERSIFATFFENTINLLENNEEYAGFDNRNKLLSFYFTFFENLTSNRSFVLSVLSKDKEKLKALSILSDLRKKFKSLIHSLEIKPISINDTRLDKIQERTIEESAWTQLLITIKFWMSDASPAFEKTDVFIEKAVNASFDLIDNTPLNSIIDLGKFLVKEKFNMKM